MTYTNYLLFFGLLFDIVAFDVQELVKYKLLYFTVIEVYCVMSKPYFNFEIDLINVMEVLTSKMFLQAKE